MWWYIAITAWVLGTIFDLFVGAYLIRKMKRWLVNHRILGNGQV